MSAAGLGSQLRARRAPRPRPGRRRRRRGLGREVEDHAVQVGAGDPVDHAVVHLGNQRPAIPGESLDDPVLPQRVIAVEPLGHHPGHQVGELLVSPGRRQGGPPDVITKIEVRVLNPDRPPEAERHRAKLLPVTGHERQAPGEVGEHLLMRWRRTLEHGDRRDRHRDVRVRVLRVDERGVQRVQPVHDGPLPSRAGLAAPAAGLGHTMIPSGHQDGRPSGAGLARVARS